MLNYAAHTTAGNATINPKSAASSVGIATQAPQILAQKKYYAAIRRDIFLR